MLRRPPTTIRLTSEDILAYDDRNLRKQQEQNENNESGEGTSKQQHKGPAKTPLTKEQRIGIKR